MKPVYALLCLLPLSMMAVVQNDTKAPAEASVVVVSVIKKEGNVATKSQPGPSDLKKPDRAYLKMLKESREVTAPTVTVIDKTEADDEE